MVLKAKAKEWTIVLTGTWICPKCGIELEVKYNPNPYRIIADDVPEDICPNCDTIYALNFYDE